MSHLLLYYQRPEPATWVFLSSFLMISVYFVFHRFFCVRNLDIVLLLLLAPGLMMVYEGRRMQATAVVSAEAEKLALRHGIVPADDAGHRPTLTATLAVPSDAGASASRAGLAAAVVPNGDEVAVDMQSADTRGAGNPGPTVRRDGYPVETSRRQEGERLEFYGFLALLGACALLLIRMLCDPALVRRPLLDPNLSIGGLTFIGGALFLFLMANVITSTPEDAARGPRLGPGYPLLSMLPELPTTPDRETRSWPPQGPSQSAWLTNLARALAILSNFLIVAGMVSVGYWHFANIRTGVGCAVLYLMLPYTAQMTGNLEHTVPAAFLVLSVLTYRQPLVSGTMLGMAAGLVYYPIFLLPLWFSFYWYRGAKRFAAGLLVSILFLVGLLLLQGMEAFGEHVRQMFGLWLPRMQGLEGIWAEGRVPTDFRLPVLVACILLSASYAFWPGRKNLGTLMSGTAALMLAVQFWHGFGGGLYMAWYLPLTILTMFRPNLDDRIALTVVRGGRKLGTVSSTGGSVSVSDR
ncbi:MAG: hypothetical protein KatS3mg111_3932 [Pirellulaceae bacterium]|nr:MAG: hypothetical protein KatS3mg111_3932 [Pirellulaceae bacterium]